MFSPRSFSLSTNTPTSDTPKRFVGTSPVEKFRTYERIPEESGDKEPGQATVAVERGSLVASFARSEFFNETASSVKSIRAS